jgi:hypothetical protein
MVTNTVRIRRFRGTRKRLARLRLDKADIVAAMAIAFFCLLCAIASAWLVVNFPE